MGPSPFDMSFSSISRSFRNKKKSATSTSTNTAAQETRSMDGSVTGLGGGLDHSQHRHNNNNNNHHHHHHNTIIHLNPSGGSQSESNNSMAGAGGPVHILPLRGYHTNTYSSFGGGGGGGTITGGGGHGNASIGDDFSIDEQTAAIEYEYAKQEAKLAIFVRAIFVLAMIVSASLVAVATFRYTTNQQIQEFETKFSEFGNQMVNAIRLNAQNSLESYQLWSLQISNIVDATNQSWPFVALPHFEAQAMQSSKQLGARIIGFSPIVPSNDTDILQQWSNYSTGPILTQWVQESLNEYDMTTTTTTTTMISVEDVQPPPFIYQRDATNANPNAPIRPANESIVPNENIFLPLWQVYPIIENYFVINFDSMDFAFVPRVFQQMKQTGFPVLSEGFIVPGSISQQPDSFMIVPVYNNVFGKSKNNNQKTLVGVLFAFFPWRDHFKDLLPDDTPPITVIVRNECVESFTFLLRGSNVTYLGIGDLHDTKYKDLEVEFDFDVFGNVPNCTNTIHVHPTKELEDIYISNNNTPLTYTLSAVGIFLFTTILFGIYDCFSQRWRKKVEIAARRNSAIVQSLFPSTVRDRLMMDTIVANNDGGMGGCGGGIGKENNSNNHNGDNNNNNNNNNQSAFRNAGENNHEFYTTTTTAGGHPAILGRKRSILANTGEAVLTRLPDLIPDLRNLTNKMPDLRNLNPMRLLEEITNIVLKENQRSGSNGNGTNSGNNNNNNNNNNDLPLFRREDKPIADLFPSATVLFGDISGFTAWSSQRDPAQVFTLLENIYNAFDRIAKRRKVFKVETIGDCYMAATGLPEVRSDHAVVMAGFARECLATMNDVVRDLEAKLGPDTGDLAMRFGIHSGPVTAGVLRGEKSRFQLFGDTVNTASRMESTGVRHKIQISQQTADLLIAAKKESWIVPREDMVEAKGKGRLQTYWLAVGSVGPSLQATSLPNARRISFKPPRRSSITTNDWDGSFRVDPTIEDVVRSVNQKIERMIDWNVQVLLKHLTSIIRLRKREEELNRQMAQCSESDATNLLLNGSERYSVSSNRSLMLEDLTEHSATTNSAAAAAAPPPPFPISLTELNVDATVVKQLREFVTAIAFMYHENPFHNFEHASHVTQSVNKMLARLVEPDPCKLLMGETPVMSNNNNIKNSSSNNNDGVATTAAANGAVAVDGEKKNNKKNTKKREGTAYALHMHTYETASDPNLKFAVAFAALIHDVDHPGVPNVQFVKEKPELSNLYNGKSVAEKNSVSVAWDLLMEPAYQELRECAFPTVGDLARFRRLVVKTVMATDIADRQLMDLRRRRWAEQFDDDDDTDDDNYNDNDNDNNDDSFSNMNEDHNYTTITTTTTLSKHNKSDFFETRSDIFIECLIQASDVSHCMQHWQIFVKWNERLFHECYHAYKIGRVVSSSSSSSSNNNNNNNKKDGGASVAAAVTADPSENWYKSELSFFDNYVLPLVARLKLLEVFGATTDEFMSYAQANRKEWEANGKDLVKEYVAAYKERVFEEDEDNTIVAT